MQDQWYREGPVPAGFAWVYRQIVRAALDQDRTIWENKLYLPRPIYSSVDGPFGAFRRWFKQFCVDDGREREKRGLVMAAQAKNKREEKQEE